MASPNDITIRLTRLFGLIGGTLMALAALLATTLPAAAETAGARPATTSSEKADALLAGLIKTNDPGLAVLVARDGKILFEKGYGLADVEHHAPVVPQTIFLIGSITKQFTGAAILKLQEERKLSVDDKLSKYIPDFPRGDKVTLRQLLNHTSGLRDYTDDQGFWGRVTNDTSDAIITALKQEPYDFDPGAKWSYSSSGYMLLGFIVEKVSGQRYGDFVRENFFQPLGMTNTGVYHGQTNLPSRALGYNQGANGFERAPDLFLKSADNGVGSLYSTVEDLNRWNEGIFNGRALEAASFKAAFKPVKTYEGQINSDAGYGFGWVVARYHGLREFRHDGDASGYRNMLVWMPDEKLTVAVLANAGWESRPKADPYYVAHQLVDIFLADKFAPQPTVNTNVSPRSYDVLMGVYEFQGKILTISARDGRLFAQFADQPEGELFPESESEFFVKTDDTRFTFVKDSRGRALIIHNIGFDLDAPRMEDISAIKATNTSLTGVRTLPKLKVSDNRHFLVTESGQPFFWLGDTGWELFHRLTREEADRYLQNRAAKGFTVIQAVIFPNDEWTPEPNAYGELPFQDHNPLKPNEKYFENVDWMVKRANALGLYIGMVPTWGNWWCSDAGRGTGVFTPENAAAYGEWLGRRYRNCGLVWILGGDHPIATIRQREIIDAMATGLRRGDGGSHLITFHPPGYSGSSQWLQIDPLFDFNLRQNGHNTEYTDDYGNTHVDYDRQPAKPVIDGEPLYEDIGIHFDGLKNGSSIAPDVRRPLYWDLFGGACGHTYGDHCVWQFWAPPRPNLWAAIQPWYEAMDAPGAFQMHYAKDLLLSRPFLARVPDDSILVPDATRTSVPGGGLYRFVATRDSEGRYAMVYAPVGKVFSARTDCIRGTKINAWWFDPRTGKASFIGTFSNSPQREFTPPNIGEALDWVLVLDDAAMNFPPPGTVTKATRQQDGQTFDAPKVH